jgi:hypothetical protein
MTGSAKHKPVGFKAVPGLNTATALGVSVGVLPVLAMGSAQLRRSLRVLRSAAPRVVFDRTPLDFLAYLAAQDAGIEGEADPSALRSALASLDLLIVTPITPETEQVLPRRPPDLA